VPFTVETETDEAAVADKAGGLGGFGAAFGFIGFSGDATEEFTLVCDRFCAVGI
jgi:hypothetical protein